MSRARRLGLFAVLVAVLGLAALLFASAGREPSERSGAGSGAEALALVPGAGHLLGRLREQAAAESRRRLRSEDPQAEPGPRPKALAEQRRALGQAEPIARRFHAALSRYELGRPAEAELRATATPLLARRLLRQPPRPPRGGKEPERARLGPLELVPLAGEGGRLTRVELVGTVRRGERSDPIALELRRGPGGWRVAGVGL